MVTVMLLEYHESATWHIPTVRMPGVRARPGEGMHLGQVHAREEVRQHHGIIWRYMPPRRCCPKRRSKVVSLERWLTTIRYAASPALLLCRGGEIYTTPKASKTASFVATCNLAACYEK